MKIKFSEVVEALTAAGIVPETNDRDYFPRERMYTNQIKVTVRGPRGSQYATEVGSFFVEIGARRGSRGRSFAYHSLKIDGAGWRARLAKAANDIIQRGKDFSVIDSNREDAKKTAQNAREAYAAAISDAAGKPLESWDVNTGDNSLPVGYTLRVTLTGTAEDVADRIRSIRAIAENKI